MKADLKTEDVLSQDLTFVKGMRAGTIIALGYIPIAITFGLLAKSTGIPNYITIMMSIFIFAGASQFVGINLIALGVTHWQIVIATFLLNFRHFLMSSALSQRIEKGNPKKWLALLSFGITDETFTVASLRQEKELPSTFVIGLNFIAFSAWNIGTWVGLYIATGLPSSLQSSMGIALYAMFIGLLIPSFKKSIAVILISLLSISISSILHWLPSFHSLSDGWIIIIATLFASTAGAILFPKGANDPK